LHTNEQINDKIFEKIVKIKFLNGEVNYTNKEIQILRAWLQQNNPEVMYELFTHHVIRGLLKKSQEYDQSSLQRLFHELMQNH
jgi:hypothetical protein